MQGTSGPDESVLRALPSGAIPARSLRLFWSWVKPVTITNEAAARQAIATILLEGTPSDWREIDFAALAPLCDDLPLFGGAKILWSEISREAAVLQDNRDRVLTLEHRRILRVAAGVLPAHGFELAGGTALAAVHLGHRRSDDLDFFTSAKEIKQGLEEFIAACGENGLQVEQSPEETAGSFARVFVQGIKVELGRDTPFKIAESRATLEGVPVRSLPDLAADKTLALFGRAATRDFVDIYELMRTRYDMSDLINLAKQKDTGFNIGWFVKALQQVEQVDRSAVDLLVPLDFEQMKTDIRAATKRIIRKELEQNGPDLSL